MRSLYSYILRWGMVWILASVHIGLTAAEDTIEQEQIHLSLGREESEMVVTWVTMQKTSPPYCLLGPGTDRQRKIFYGSQKAFVDAGKTKRTIYVHRVTFDKLSPDTSYAYQCGSFEGESSEYKFKTPPFDSNWSPRVFIYGDLGFENAVSVPKLIDEAQRTDAMNAVIHVGDIAYDMHDDEGERGDEFMRLIEPIAARVPYMVSPGNHERYYNFSHYRERFTMPGNSENLYYSYNLGPVHFISINTEAYWNLEYGVKLVVDQYYWLKRDLEAANKNREKTPWIVLYGHRPMYCSGQSYECLSDPPVRSGLNNRLFGLEKLLYEHRVDIVFWGHQHSYERHWPIFDYKIMNGSNEQPYVNPKAPIHIITGAAGSKEHIDPGGAYILRSSAFRSKEYGITELIFHNSSHLSITQISTATKDRIIDKIIVVRER